MIEIPRPILGQQPPMPGTNLVPVNLVQGPKICQNKPQCLPCHMGMSLALCSEQTHKINHQHLKNIILILIWKPCYTQHKTMQEVQDKTHQKREDVTIVELQIIGKKSALTRSNPTSSQSQDFVTIAWSLTYLSIAPRALIILHNLGQILEKQTSTWLV